MDNGKLKKHCRAETFSNIRSFPPNYRLPCVKGYFPDRENVSVADKRVPAFGERWQKSLIFDGGIVKWIENIINLSFIMQKFSEKI